MAHNDNDDPAGDGPQWDPSGWHPVYLGDPNKGDARLVGHTRLALPVDRLVISRAGDEPDEMILSGDMIRRPHRREDGLFWAWELMQAQDLPHVPEFRPVRH